MATLTEPIRPKKLHEQVAERLQTMIIERQLAPGDRLPSERELQAMFGIGRPAVREALLLLERSGLIALRSGSPATVIEAEPENIIREIRTAVDHFLADPQGVKEIQAARALIECGLARQAARQRTDADLDSMRNVLERSTTALDDQAGFERLDREFHTAIVRVSGIKLFEAVLQAMSEWLHDQRMTNLAMPGHADMALAYHQDIFKSIEARDADGAEQAMLAHLKHAERVYWAAQQVASRKTG